ncbi:MAG: DUF3592 domain-containing protein [Planctomycetota bacterium]
MSRSSTSSSVAALRKRAASWALLVTGCLFLLLTPIGAWGAWSAFTSAHASSSWPSVDGTIIRSTVHGVGEGRDKAFIEYRYAVDDHTHTSNRIKFGSIAGNSETAQQAIADKYPIGTTVKVHYDPDMPTNAVLKPGVGAGTWFYLAIPFVLPALGLYLLKLRRSASATNTKGSATSDNARRTGNSDEILSQQP